MSISESFSTIGVSIQPSQAVSQDRVWLVQAWGLILIALMSLWPKLFHFQEYLFFTLLIWAIASSLKNGHPVWIRTELDLALVVLVGWVLCTVPFSLDPSYSFSEWRKLLVNVLVFYWALLVFKRQQGDQEMKDLLHAVALAVVCGSIVIATYALWSFAERGGGLLTRAVRANAPSSGSHRLGIYMVMALPFACYVFFAYRRLRQRTLTGYGIIVLTLAEFFSYSRGGWLALAMQALSVAAFRGTLSRLLRVGLLCLVCVVCLFMLSEAGYLEGVFVIESIADRISCWDLGLQALAERPIVGIGFGNEIFGKMYPGDPPGLCSDHPHLHSSFMMYVVGSGVPVILLLLGIGWKTISVFLRETEIVLNRDAAALKLTVLVVTVGFVTCNFLNYFFSGSLAYLFFIVFAGGLSLAMISRSDRTNYREAMSGDTNT